ncbi:MAG: hypothetical protein GXN91_00045 [Epsilonproteobacteria bacterium]|nr:hypothetical protein [Campylobacterota bacterium]
MSEVKALPPKKYHPPEVRLQSHQENRAFFFSLWVKLKFHFQERKVYYRSEISISPKIKYFILCEAKASLPEKRKASSGSEISISPKNRKFCFV